MNLNNPSVLSKDKDFSLSYKTSLRELDKDGALREKFISSGVEHAVRNSPEYDNFVRRVHEAGFDHCSIMGKAKGNKMKLDVHHGPMFTLYDICDIVLLHLTKSLKKDQDAYVTSFEIASLVIEEHKLNNVQCVVLSKTPHKAVDTNMLFLHCDMSIGRVDRFIEKYDKGINNIMKAKIKKYVKQCEEYDGTLDNGLFETSQRLSFK